MRLAASFFLLLCALCCCIAQQVTHVTVNKVATGLKGAENAAFTRNCSLYTSGEFGLVRISPDGHVTNDLLEPIAERFRVSRIRALGLSHDARSGVLAMVGVPAIPTTAEAKPWVLCAARQRNVETSGRAAGAPFGPGDCVDISEDAQQANIPMDGAFPNGVLLDQIELDSSDSFTAVVLVAVSRPKGGNGTVLSITVTRHTDELAGSALQVSSSKRALPAGVAFCPNGIRKWGERVVFSDDDYSLRSFHSSLRALDTGEVLFEQSSYMDDFQLICGGKQALVADYALGRIIRVGLETGKILASTSKFSISTPSSVHIVPPQCAEHWGTGNVLVTSKGIVSAYWVPTGRSLDAVNFEGTPLQPSVC